MSDMRPEKIIQSLCLQFGGQTGLAKKLGVSQPTVRGWLNGEGISAASAIGIEKLTDGESPVECTCPALEWSVVRNSYQRVNKV